MDPTRIQRNNQSLHHTFTNDSSFFENKLITRNDYSDLQVVPTGSSDVFDSWWRNGDSDVLSQNIRTISSNGELSCSKVISSLPGDYSQVTQLQSVSNAERKASDSDSLDVYLKPCVITPTKVEDLYSTLDNNSDEVFQFPPKDPQQFSDQSDLLPSIQLSEFTNFGCIIDENNSNDSCSLCHDNHSSNQVCSREGTENSLDLMQQTQHNLQHTMGLFFPPFVKHLPQDCSFNPQTAEIKNIEPAAPLIMTALRNDQIQQSTIVHNSSRDKNNYVDENPFYSQQKEECTSHHHSSYYDVNTQEQWPTTLTNTTNLPTQSVESRDLKAFHNGSEKYRRDQMKARFENLRKAIPKVDRLPKSSKILVLQKAKEYILHLEKEDNKLEALKTSIKLKNRQLLEKLQSILK